MATFSYFIRCPSCNYGVEAEISVQPEQQGGPETEYLPEHWELDGHLVCSCGYQFTRAEEQVMVDAARRELGR
jgi:hypothetical protein